MVFGSGHKGDGEGQDPHPAQIHQQNDQALRSGRQVRGNAAGQPHRGHGRGHLEGGIQIRQILHGGEEHGGRQEQKEHHQDQGHGAQHPAVGNGPPPEGDLLPPGQPRAQGQQQHADGNGLKAARGGAGGAADEHQDDRHGLAAVGQSALAQSVKSGGTQGDRLEQGVEPLFPQRHPAQRGGVFEFFHKKEGRAAQDQRRRDEQYHLAVYAQTPPAALGQDILPDEKTDAPHHDQRGGGAQDQRIAVIAGQAGEGAELSPQQVKPRVAERGDRVKHRMPDAPQQAKVRHHPDGQQRRARPLQQEGPHQGVAHHPHDPVQVVQVQGGDHDEPLGQADAPVQRKGKQGDDRHKPQAAQLDHAENDRLSEQGPLRPGIHQDQTRDAGGRRGGKQRRKHSGALPVPGGRGQREQQRAGQDDQGEGAGHQAGGVEAPAADQAVPQPEGDLFDQRGTSRAKESTAGRTRAGAVPTARVKRRKAYRGWRPRYAILSLVQRLHGREYYLGIVVTSHKFL